MKRSANAVWQGSGLEGSGALTTRSGALSKHPYTFKTRFKNEDGTLGSNTEELLAAAHAGCFTMALSFQLGGAGFTPEELFTEAVVEMENEGVHYHIKRINLRLEAKVPGISEDQLTFLARQAKDTCPISEALAAIEINLEVNLVQFT